MSYVRQDQKNMLTLLEMCGQGCVNINRGGRNMGPGCMKGGGYVKGRDCHGLGEPMWVWVWVQVGLLLPIHNLYPTCGYCNPPCGYSSAKRISSYSTYFTLFLTYTSYFGGKKGISRNKMIFFFLMLLVDYCSKLVMYSQLPNMCWIAMFSDCSAWKHNSVQVCLLVVATSHIHQPLWYFAMHYHDANTTEL